MKSVSTHTSSLPLSLDEIVINLPIDTPATKERPTGSLSTQPKSPTSTMSLGLTGNAPNIISQIVKPKDELVVISAVKTPSTLPPSRSEHKQAPAIIATMASIKSGDKLRNAESVYFLGPPHLRLPEHDAILPPQGAIEGLRKGRVVKPNLFFKLNRRHQETAPASITLRARANQLGVPPVTLPTAEDMTPFTPLC